VFGWLSRALGVGRRVAQWILIGIGLLVALAVALVLALVVFANSSGPGKPGKFYAAPSPLPAGPAGTIIRSEVIDSFHSGATAYRVLYKSTGYDGKPTAVSGLIVVPDGGLPSGGRKVIAYTHGTVGVASNCAPSLVTNQEQQPLLFEGGGELLAAGYVVAASDYQGLGTPGPHPYLVGDSEAMNELDIVRAAHNLPKAHASTDFAVWGHSQGGHAALFTGQLATSYAPELHLFGVAAGGPVPNLVDLFKVNFNTTVGKILIAMALQSWAKVYNDAHLDQIVTPAARPLVRSIAKNCLYTKRQILSSVPGALALKLTFLHTPPWQTEPWKTILAKNTPGATRTTAPILIIQGDQDPIVAPDVTARLADKLCTEGDTIKLLVLEGTAHLEAGHVAVPDVVQWIADRFAGQAAPSTCPA
jgi:pimeloyl-ACP methyl ester carboxylesterase